ncbi:MAG: hypothetical protein A3F72_09020 [Bacteroidetes bacterium RIFCSPLOWO2_12_FULL_35_15]|nr:MAG: hypothetical protein A3F72_09020 [Bacteroidetes bacterium RIFCSPLOWO2_12_FULL_35_15]
MKYYFTIVFLFCGSTFFGQTPSVQWKKTLGGTSIEEFASAQQTVDGGYIIAGDAFSNNGDVTGNHGGGDVWVVKLNSIGTIQWEKTYGGTLADVAYSIKQTNNGGYIVVGQSSSNNGDVTGHHGSTSSYDYWILKIDSLGVIEWEKSLGGSGYDAASSVIQTSDNGYIIAGQSSSSDGDITGHHGLNYDAWVVKLDSMGTIEWQKSLGGTNSDSGNKLIQTIDNGFILVGMSASNDGDLTSNFGLNDLWVVKLNSIGAISWQKTYGGTGEDFGTDVKQTLDGGYIVGGQSNSNDGDVLGNIGGSDYWLLKLDSTGTIQWQKSYGGTGDDGIASLQLMSDGGYLIGGSADSTNGDVIGTHIRDYWIIKSDSIGTIQWQLSFGGSAAEWLNSVQQTSDNGYFLCGSTYSNDGDITGNHGSFDYWVLKLNTLTTDIYNQGNKTDLNIYPNPTEGIITIELDSFHTKTNFKIINVLGQTVLSGIITTRSTNLNIDKLPNDIYLFQLGEDKGRWFKIIKK